MDGFAGLSGTGPDTVWGNGAQSGLIFPRNTYTHIPDIFDGGYLRKGIHLKSPCP